MFVGYDLKHVNKPVAGLMLAAAADILEVLPPESAPTAAVGRTVVDCLIPAALDRLCCCSTLTRHKALIDGVLTKHRNDQTVLPQVRTDCSAPE